MGMDSPANIEHMQYAHTEKAEQKDISVDKLVDGLNESTIDETSDASSIELNGVKFSLEKTGLEGYVIANIDGGESVVLKKDTSTDNNVWSVSKGMNADMLRGAKETTDAFGKGIASNQ